MNLSRERAEQLFTLLKKIADRSSDAFPSSAAAVSFCKVPAPLIDEARSLITEIEKEKP